MRRQNKAFTLVELLVVVGIITLLIAMLLPALNRVRAAANMVVCASNQRTIGQALNLHAIEHRGYYPLSGKLFIGGSMIPNVASNLPATPANLGDVGRQKYDYYTDTTTAALRPMPMAAALSSYLGVRSIRADSTANMQADLATGTLRKIFMCPEDRNNVNSLTQGIQITDNRGSPLFQVTTWDSYCQNTELFGWSDAGLIGVGHGGSTDHSRARGQISAMRNPSETMVMCDGLPLIAIGAPIGGIYEIYGHTNGNTLSDAYLQINGAGNTINFDIARHHARMNVLFIDGHVDNFVLDPKNAARDLGHVYLALGLR